MTHTLRIEISDEMKAKLEAALVTTNQVTTLAGTPAMGLAEIVRAAIAKGLDMAPNTPPENVPLVALTLAQFAKLTGIGDLDQARKNAHEAMQHQAKAMEQAEALLGDLKRIRFANLNARFNTPQEVQSWAESTKQQLTAAPTHHILIAYAVVPDSHGVNTPNPGTVN